MRNEEQEAQWQALRKKIAVRAYKWANGFDPLDKSFVPWDLIKDKQSFFDFADGILAMETIEVRDKRQKTDKAKNWLCGFGEIVIKDGAQHNIGHCGEESQFEAMNRADIIKVLPKN
ncbi:MAG: hypothetical protein V2A77_05085 [Pseudomonadota bacterium]